MQGNITFMTILNKKGAEYTAQIDSVDMERVKNAGTWFAEWNKDFNSYLVQNISSSKTNKKFKPLKQSLQSFIMDSDIHIPIKHINRDTLDNRKSNLVEFKLTDKNETEKVDDDTIAILLKDKYGNSNSKALISASDFKMVVTDNYTWINYKVNNEVFVVANTPNGRIFLDKIIMEPSDTELVHHINLNPLDNRRQNLELKNIEI